VNKAQKAALEILCSEFQRRIQDAKYLIKKNTRDMHALVASTQTQKKIIAKLYETIKLFNTLGAGK
jgi:hypothetical protein